jgi:hypothetical protein
MAGHTFAKALIGAYYMDPIDEWQRKHPDVHLDIYIDDLTMSCCGASEEYVVERLAAAARDLQALIEKDLKCTIAKQKAAAVASTASLANKLRTRIGENAGRPVRSTPNLGADFSWKRKEWQVQCGRRPHVERHPQAEEAQETSTNCWVQGRIPCLRGWDPPQHGLWCNYKRRQRP